VISEEKLQAYNQIGLIPGPAEDEAGFLKRVQKILNPSVEEMPISGTKVEKDQWIAAHQLTKELFDFQVCWLPAVYSKRNLPFWQGAAAWIYQDVEGVKKTVLQLRPSMKFKPYLGLYPQQEVLAHEIAHAARMAFDEPHFEEKLAFLTSKSGYRRFLGPFFRSSKESYVFVILLILPLLTQIASLFFEASAFFTSLSFLPWCCLAFGLIRLLHLQNLFKKSIKKIRCLLKDPKKATAVLFRLTDQEIIFLAKHTLEEIQLDIAAKKHTSLRWKVLFKAYF